MGYTDDYTELELKKLEKRIASEYRKAYASISAQADSYFEQFIDRYEKEHDAYMKGLYTKEEFDAWYRTQVARGEGWVQFKEDIASRITNANEIAASYINGTTPKVFKENKNYTSYEISQLHAGASFRVYNEEAIKELMMNKNHSEFRTVAINPTRDYEWNQKQIQSALLSGIIQGKPAKQIADSFMPVMKRNKAAAIRNARTAVTSACNGGRINALHEAQHKGIEVRKKWLCMRDRRVRNSHVNLDGQIRDIDDPFDNDLMYPADPDGIGAEVYNCRCRLTYVYPKYENEKSRETFSESKYEGETYQEWLKRMEDEQDYASQEKGQVFRVNFKKLTPKAVKILAEQENVEQLKLIKDLVSDYLPNNPSRWNGTVNINPNYIRVAGYRRRTGTIVMRKENIPISIKMHEIVHSTTIYTEISSNTAAVNGILNESAVELFTQEVCKANGLPYTTGYASIVKPLRNLAELMEVTPLELSSAIVAEPYDQRYNTLKALCDMSKQGKTKRDCKKIDNNLGNLYGNIKNK